MSSLITEYRADFYKPNNDIKFRVDSQPEKDDVSFPVPILIQGAQIHESGNVTVRWVRPQLEPYIGALVDLVDTSNEPDVICVYALSPDGNSLKPPVSTNVARIEAFAVSTIGAVKIGCMMDVWMRMHDELVLPTTTNYVLERLCFDLNSHVQLFNSVDKLVGKRPKSSA